MTYKSLKNKIKEEQKSLAYLIRRGKFFRKLKNRATQTEEEKKLYGDKIDIIDYNVRSFSQDYRSIHIAYCHFFNKTPYEKIEKPRKKNPFNTYLYEKCIRDWEKILNEETVRVDSN